MAGIKHGNKFSFPKAIILLELLIALAKDGMIPSTNMFMNAKEDQVSHKQR